VSGEKLSDTWQHKVDIAAPKFMKFSMCGIIPNFGPSSQLVSNQFIEHICPLQFLDKWLQRLLIAAWLKDVNRWRLLLTQAAQSVFQYRAAKDRGRHMVVLTFSSFAKKRLGLLHIIGRHICENCFLYAKKENH